MKKEPKIKSTRKSHEEVRNHPLKKLCRLCLLSDGKMEPLMLFEKDNSFINKIYDCVGLKIDFKEETTTIVCAKCKEMIEKYHQFKFACLKNDEILKNLSKLLLAPDDLQEIQQNNVVEVEAETPILKINPLAETPEEVVVTPEVPIEYVSKGRGRPRKIKQPVEDNDEEESFLVDMTELPDSSNYDKVDKRTKEWKHLKLVRKMGKKNKLRECEICGKSYANIWLHKQQHKEKSFACHYCDMKFHHKAVWEQHEHIHKRNRENDRVHTCEVCNLEFIRIGKYKEHLATTEHLLNAKRYEETMKGDTQGAYRVYIPATVIKTEPNNMNVDCDDEY